MRSSADWTSASRLCHCTRGCVPRSHGPRGRRVACETSKSLDAAKRGFERTTIVLAPLAVILTAGGRHVAIASL